jgi:hypothetical protein
MKIKKTSKKTRLNKTDMEKAISLLRNPLLLYLACKKVRELGIVGERRNILIVLLAAIARVFSQPPSVLIKGPTSSGKSTLVKTTLLLFPPGCIMQRAGLSAKALAHGKGSLAHKILFIHEYRCGKDARLLLRLLQSEGRITHEFTA